MYTKQISKIAAGITFLVLASIACAQHPQEIDPTTRMHNIYPHPTGSSPYQAIDFWLKPFAEDGYTFGGIPSVYAESSDRVFALQRGESLLPSPVPESYRGYIGSAGVNAQAAHREWRNVIFAVDSNGEMLEAWSQWDYLFQDLPGSPAHMIRINPYDAEARVWVINETAHQIYVFSNDGEELLLTLGERAVSGNDRSHFGRPQDVAFLPDGRVLVADGYENSRVVVLDSDGNYLTEFGDSGVGLGQFNIVHAIAIGPDGHFFIADRDNNRVQMFRVSDEAANWYHPEFAPIDAWPTGESTLDLIANDDGIWVAHLSPAKMTKYDFSGNRIFTWNFPSRGAEQVIEPHGISVDEDGNLYIADIQIGRMQKFEPRTGADPRLMISPPYVAQ